MTETENMKKKRKRSYSFISGKGLEEEDFTYPDLFMHDSPTPPLTETEKRIDKMIRDTFYSLNKNKNDPYCVHDISDNCFETIEEFREAVKNIVISAMREVKQIIFQQLPSRKDPMSREDIFKKIDDIINSELP